MVDLRHPGPRLDEHVAAIKDRLRRALGIDRDDLVVRCRVVSLDDVTTALLDLLPESHTVPD